MQGRWTNHYSLMLSMLAMLWATPLKAEYRVYKYSVSSRNSNPLEKGSFLVTSTLDPVSYVAYHGGPSAIRLDLLATWVCKGYTGKKPPCPGPMSKLMAPETVMLKATP